MIENKKYSKFAFNFGTPISTLASNKEGKLLAVGGRDILKIVEVSYSEQKFQIKRTLKLPRVDVPKQNTNYIEWNPNEDNKIAAAALGGSISIWDINQGAGAKLNQIFKAHSQAINKLNWHPNEENVLISASHDGSVKLWDIKNAAGQEGKNLNQTATCQIRLSDSVRDIKFVPGNPYYFVAALENGSIEMFDRRETSKNITSNSLAHKGAVLAMDFNPTKKSIFATGSMDKEVKIWDMVNLEKEKYKIQYHHSVGFVKWKNDCDRKICISSISTGFQKDTTLSLWDTNKLQYPDCVIRGHKDVITACIFSPQSDNVITSSRDGYVICHDWESAYRPMDHCNKYGLAFDFDSTCSFSFAPNEKPKSSSSPQNIYLVSELNSYQGSQFKTLKEEINYYDLKYKAGVDGGIQLFDLCEHNAEVSCNKKFISSIWRDIPPIIKDLDVERTDTENLSFTKFLKQTSKLEGELPNKELRISRGNKLTLNPDELNSLINFYESHPEKFRADIEQKNVIIKDGRVYIKPNYVKEAFIMIEEIGKENEKNQKKLGDNKKIEKLQAESIIRSIQEIINCGDLQTAYYMYFILSDKMNFPQNFVKQWAQAYIELLRTYQFYLQSNEVIRSCPLELINEGNKKSTTFFARCGKCKKLTENQEEPLCSNCKEFISVCSICKLPIKGMMLWCQICGHGGHYKEMKEWFKNHDQCPSGCQHKCFNIKKKDKVPK